MGPVKGNKKKRKVEKKIEENSMVSVSSEEGSTDSSDVLSKILAGDVKMAISRSFLAIQVHCNVISIIVITWCVVVNHIIVKSTFMLLATLRLLGVLIICTWFVCKSYDCLVNYKNVDVEGFGYIYIVCIRVWL